MGVELTDFKIEKINVYNYTNIHFPIVFIINQKNKYNWVFIYGLNKYCYDLWNIGEENPPNTSEENLIKQI